MVFIKVGVAAGGSTGLKEACLGNTTRAHRTKNRKKCDEMAKKRDELVTGAFLRVEKAGRSGHTAGGRRLLSRRHQGAEEKFG
jgi:hypothetical protein